MHERFVPEESIFSIRWLLRGRSSETSYLNVPSSSSSCNGRFGTRDGNRHRYPPIDRPENRDASCFPSRRAILVLFPSRIKALRPRGGRRASGVDEKGQGDILDPANRETRYVQVARAHASPGLRNDR